MTTFEPSMQGSLGLAKCGAGRLPRLALLIGVCGVVGGAQRTDWLPARSGYEWSFPRDHWSHPGYKTEWWYLTGIVAAQGDPAERFGYQFTFFRVGLTPAPRGGASTWATSDLIMGHMAVSRPDQNRYVTSEVLYRTTPFLGAFGSPGDSVIAWSQAPPGTDGRWTLAWNGSGFDVRAMDEATRIHLDIRTTPRKPIVLHGSNGYSPKGTGPTAASHYYSLTRLDTKGSLSIDGESFSVEGESWMDKEFGSNQLSEGQTGWDWFSLRLDDGRDVMLYLLRNDAGVDFAAGTAVTADGASQPLAMSDFTVTPIETWRSPRTGGEYPARWRVNIPRENLTLDIVPVMADQELVARLVPDLHYWEGMIDVRATDGRRIGEGYVELTGYGTNSRPAI